ncbi:hypothetical protein IE81DRAFT_364125 [Ceraceosorus guamensis]|uniref:Uncharacterized protein n=1 Tax=Ceraceosorus guamensis TaxID=1522189 RepID=A0A316W6S7_9BASI|nr:hypothetical protein IE81DRAFT_364125 [Ceraceosorus guamensis]PWN45492.1 hypothetical protein IE81DRAFT_364125 [Ceraceosorus guamensis]
MFKKAPTIKPSTLVRSSNRRSLIAQLQSQFPAFASASPDLVLKLVPETLHQRNASTHADDKAVLYTDEKGRPLWFEIGNTAGKGAEKAGKGKGLSKVEVIPTVYALWLLPTLLPRVPTESKLVASADSALMSGTSLMVPGFLPPPNTFPISSGSDLPRTGDLISITAQGSSVPLVVGKLEIDMKDIVERRSKGEKGKAVKILHTHWDELWALGGSKEPPSEAALPDVSSLSLATDSSDPAAHGAAAEAGASGAAEKAEPDSTEDAGAGESGLAAEDGPQGDTADLLADLLSGGGDAEEDQETSSRITALTAKDVDALLDLALLSAVAQDTPEELPVESSIFYQLHVLPNRPTTWPPTPEGGLQDASYDDVEPKRQKTAVRPDDDVRKSSAKKLAKWVKTAEKSGVFKTKDVKGKTLITEFDTDHPDVTTLKPFITLKSLTSSDATEAADEIDHSAPHPAGSETTSNPNLHLRTVVERFWTPSNQAVKLFQSAGYPTSAPSSRPAIREMLEAYVAKHQLRDGRQKDHVRLNDTLLVNALFPKASANKDEVPAVMSKPAILDKLISTSCTEHHRVSRLSASKAAQAEKINAELGGEDVELEEGESRGPMRKGVATPVRIEIKQRQGKKVVSLVTGLESFGVDPKDLAAECKRKMGASASVSPLATSSPKNPLFELLIQGNQSIALVNMLADLGVEKRLVKVEDGGKGKK